MMSLFLYRFPFTLLFLFRCRFRFRFRFLFPFPFLFRNPVSGFSRRPVVVALHDALCFTDMDDLQGGKISTIFLNEFAARDKGNFHAPGKNRTRDPPVQWLERPINMWHSEDREFNSRLGYENFRYPRRAWFPLLPSWKCSLEVYVCCSLLYH